MSKNINSFNPDAIGLSKNTLKNLITNDIIQLIDSIEPLQKSSEDSLQELTNSIGQIDFPLLAFPEIKELQKEYSKLQLDLFGKLGEVEPIYLDKESTEYKENPFKLLDCRSAQRDRKYAKYQCNQDAE